MTRPDADPSDAPPRSNADGGARDEVVEQAAAHQASAHQIAERNATRSADGSADQAAGKGAAEATPEGGDAFGDEGEEIPDKLFFRIGEAASLVGVEPHVLRYWESEFRMRPQRSQSGQRMFRRKDIAQFMRIRRLLHSEGFTIAGARKALADPTGDNAAPPRIDTSRVSQAATRIASLREQIATHRARIATTGAGLDVEAPPVAERSGEER